jgi:Putative peptidoglycan binding domain
MSTPTSTRVPGPGVPAPGPAEPDRQVPRTRKRRRRLLAGAAVVVLVAAAGVVVAATDPFDSRNESRGAVGGSTTNTALATVREGPLSAQVNQSGTLSYAAQADGSPYAVVNQASGTYTWLPSAGRGVRCGQVLYRVEETPVVLLCGRTPAYRELSVGDSGRDVRELNRNLVRLGYADRAELDPSSDEFGSETAAALERLQDKLGVDQTGSLDLGAAVFLPGPLRVTKVIAKPGTRAAPGMEVAQATSTRRQVTVELSASQQSQVKVGDRAQVTLPGNRTTPGVVSRLGTIANSSDDTGSGSGAGSGSSTATLPVYVTLKRPKAAGSLDQAPVQVQITTAGVKRALVVPVTALVGQAGGGFAVETVDAQGVHQLVPVTLGLFDDANGLVQVSGELSAGQRVVVPAT